MNLIYWAKRFKRLLFLKLKLKAHYKVDAPYLWFHTTDRESNNAIQCSLKILHISLPSVVSLILEYTRNA